MNNIIYDALDDLLDNDIDQQVMLGMLEFSGTCFMSWEYQYSLDIMNLNFPFLY